MIAFVVFVLSLNFLALSYFLLVSASHVMPPQLRQRLFEVLDKQVDDTPVKELTVNEIIGELGGGRIPSLGFVSR